jgi:protein O-mannosyl-transferase
MTYNLQYVIINLSTTEPFWFHVTDRLIHAAVSALVIPTATLMFTSHVPIGGFDPTAAAFIAALLFASHPVHVESVANTTGRAEVLCGLFYLLGFLVRDHSFHKVNL